MLRLIAVLIILAAWSATGHAHFSRAQDDEAGRRWKLTGAGADRTFAYRADGLMVSTTLSGQAYAAAYGDNGLLATRTNPFRSVNVQTRDTLGRITDLRTTVGGVLVLKETVPQWRETDKIFGLYSERVGAGSWSEYRDYQYDSSGRLIYEEFVPFGAAGEDTLYTTFDGSLNWPSPTGGIGVRTTAQRNSDWVIGSTPFALHSVPGVATYARVTSENLGGSEPRALPLSGTAVGAGKVTLTLDGRDITPVSFGGWQDANGNWSADAQIAPGLHYLTATATHPSGWTAAPANSFFQVLPRAESVTNSYDEMGNVATRTWSGGKVQTLTWDPRGRLVKVEQTGVNPFIWTALYDGLDRRIKTTYTPNGGATVTTKSVFDPEAEFIELGLAIDGAWNWKVYGPDMSGTYGGLEGLGGLEAVIGSDGTTRGIVNDWFGNATGYVAAPGQTMTWSSAQFLAWGPAPGWSTAPLDGTKPLHELLGYRGLTVDPPGYVHQGLRDYDPQVGRWLSPDPFGHAGSLSLYDYCDNDPLNVFDPDGRFGKSPTLYNSRASTGSVSHLYSDYATTSSISPYSRRFDLDSAVGQVASFIPFAKNVYELTTGKSFTSPGMLASRYDAFEGLLFETALTAATLPMGGSSGVASRAFAASGTRLAEYSAIRSIPASGLSRVGRLPLGYEGGPGAMWIGENLAPRAAATDIIKAPTSLTGNYRARYLKADPGLPDGWQVHHSIPQKYQQSFADLGIDVGDIQFLRGVDPKIHSRITTEWGRFDARFGGNPSPADVARFSKHIDDTFGDSLRIPGF